MKLNLENALIVGKAIREELVRDEKEAVIAICDSYGELILLMRTDNAPLSSIKIATNKAYTAARERKDTVEIGNIIRDVTKGYDIQFWGDERYTGFGGGVVVKAENRVLGAIAVSGLPSAEDISYAKAGLRLLENL
jgi:uncharacterized protein GlcG (DUF336 family)